MKTIEQLFYGYLWLAVAVAVPASFAAEKAARMLAAGAMVRVVSADVRGAQS